MASSRSSRRGMAISRRRRQTARDVFIAEARNSLPRSPTGASTQWEANALSIERSIAADRRLAAHGFDRWGRRTGGDDA
jgi:hypothetical protein